MITIKISYNALTGVLLRRRTCRGFDLFRNTKLLIYYSLYISQNVFIFVSQYKEIQKYGNFAREEILQAMLHSEGDLDSAIDELNSKWLQLFHERIWPSDDNPQQGGDSERFRMDRIQGQDPAVDICSSVTNSVLSHTSFQAVVKDKNVDLEVGAITSVDIFILISIENKAEFFTNCGK